MARFEITIWGARGSLPAPGAEMQKYGGNTSCVAVTLDDRVVVLDAGSGIEPLGQTLIANTTDPIDLFLTHGHYDHVMGLPFFAPLHVKDRPVTLHYAGSAAAQNGEALLAQFFAEPFLPFRPDDVQGKLSYAQLARSGQLSLGPTAQMTTHPVNHPGGSLALKITAQEQCFVYVPDFEHDDGPQDAALIDFLQGADLAFLDGTYAPQDYDRFRGFGHSHWDRVAEIAEAAHVSRWGIFHHAHTRKDNELDDLDKALRAKGTGGFVAAEGASFALTGTG